MLIGEMNHPRILRVALEEVDGQLQGMAAPLVELLGACFEDNPDDRPRNALALADQLTGLLQTKEPGSGSMPAGRVRRGPISHTW